MMDSNEINTLTENVNANIPVGICFSMHSRSVDNHTFVLSGQKNGESFSIEYPYKEGTNTDTLRALKVANDVMREYQFSHTCSQESAIEMKNRISVSLHVKREEVIAALGSESLEKLESSIGYSISEYHKFKLNADDEGPEEFLLSGYTVSIQNIDYVFFPKEIHEEMDDVDLAQYDKALTLSYDSMKAQLMTIEGMQEAMQSLGDFDPYKNAEQLLVMIDLFNVERHFTEEMGIGWNYSLLDEKSPLHVPEFCVNNDGSERYIGMHKAICVLVLLNHHPDFYTPVAGG